MVRLGVWVWGGRPHKGSAVLIASSQGRVSSQVVPALTTWLRECLSGCSPGKYPPPLPHCTLGVSPTPAGRRRYDSSLLEGETHTTGESSSAGNSPLLPTYLFVYFYQHGLMEMYLYFSYNPIAHDLFGTQVVPALATWGSFRLAPVTCSHSSVVFVFVFWVLSYRLAGQDAPGPFYISLPRPPDRPLLQGALVPLLGNGICCGLNVCNPQNS